jgi:hypothetical protein
MHLGHAVLIEMLEHRATLTRLRLRAKASKLVGVLVHAHKRVGRHALVVGELDLALLGTKNVRSALCSPRVSTSRICSVSDSDSGVADWPPKDVRETKQTQQQCRADL